MVDGQLAVTTYHGRGLGADALSFRSFTGPRDHACSEAEVFPSTLVLFPIVVGRPPSDVKHTEKKPNARRKAGEKGGGEAQTKVTTPADARASLQGAAVASPLVHSSRAKNSDPVPQEEHERTFTSP